MTSSLKGRLLVATPPLVDENFDRTVVLLIEHGAEGAVGVVLNRPTFEGIGTSLDRWAPFVSEPSVFFSGGPVETNGVIGLGRSRAGEPPPDEPNATPWSSPVVEGIVTVDLTTDPLDVVGGLEALRLFRGYAGWGAGQLEGELSAGAWIIVASHPGDAFTGEPLGLWRVVLARQGGRLAWMANYPDDVEVN